MYGRHGYQGSLATFWWRRIKAGGASVERWLSGEHDVTRILTLHLEKYEAAYPHNALDSRKAGDIGKFFLEANSGNLLAGAVVDEFAVYMARAIYNIVLMYDPQDRLFCRDCWHMEESIWKRN